ncbi:MAG TPA: ElyC/SanA/YdcF family protein [Candidatus Paceibacterota bacterium]|nr:ElyC/SanA/YdcF family protein [Candidatus Paceibacterota bacterium]
MNKKLLRILALAAFLMLVLAWFADRQIESTAQDFVYTQMQDIPYNKAGLLLGTAKTLSSGQQNLYFEYRIQAAVELFQAGKIEYLVISGDNSRKEYNEPEDMKIALVARGIPESKLYLDYAGFRTYDSVVRMEKIFGQTNFTIISQAFHNERAIYIARSRNLEVIGFNAQDAYLNADIKTKIREKFARVKAVLDVFFRKEPKFLGEKIEIK